MNKILLVEHIHPAGEALLASGGEIVQPQPQNADREAAVAPLS